MTLDPSSWYFGRSLLVLLLLSGLAAYGCVISTGGRSPVRLGFETTTR
jgi:hypothetical protein